MYLELQNKLATKGGAIMIEIKNLTKIFKKPIREEGVLGMFKTLFSRKYTSKVAVNNISLSINDGEIVGYIIFWVKEEGLGHIIALAVDKKFRRQHIATRLLMMAISIFKNIDIHRITLEVKSHNEIAVSFYQKFGFEIDRKVPNYYEDGSDAYVMLFSTGKISN